LRDKVPTEILRRKKVGFPVPYESWMRNELKGWVRDILLDRQTLNRGYFNKKAIEHLIDQDREYHTYPKEILSLVSLELWHRSFVNPSRNTDSSTNPLPVNAAF
jgi:asparagine synthase (glutamine-hydrolysing)